MASAADYGSTFGFLVFAQELALLAYCLVRGGRIANTNYDGPPQDGINCADKYLALADNESLNDDTRFLFDVVARKQEGIVQNIDALDNSLIAVAVGIIAITLFAADKWFDLEPNLRFASFFCLIESGLVTLLGHLMIYFIARRTEDAASLGDFAVDFFASAAAATHWAIFDITQSVNANLLTRRYKRAFITLATLLALVAVGLIVAGRALDTPRSC